MDWEMRKDVECIFRSYRIPLIRVEKEGETYIGNDDCYESL